MKKKVRTLSACVLTILLLLSLTACGGSAASSQQTAESVKEEAAQSSEPAKEAEPTATPAPTATPEPSPTPTPEPLTAVTLSQEALEKIKDVSSYAADMLFEYDLGMGMEVEEQTLVMKMDMTMDLSVEAVTDPQASHTQGTMDMSLKMRDGGENEVEIASEQEDIESYVVADESGMFMQYSSSDGGETWSKSETDPENMLASIEKMNIYSKIADGSLPAELQEATEQLNGNEVYVVNTVLSGELLQEAVEAGLNEGADSMFGGEDVDWSAVDAPAKISFYKESGLPAEFTLDMSGFGTAIAEQMLGSAAELEGMEITTGQIALTFIYRDYDTIGEITVPEEVLQNAVESSEDEADLLEGIESFEDEVSEEAEELEEAG